MRYANNSSLYAANSAVNTDPGVINASCWLTKTGIGSNGVAVTASRSGVSHHTNVPEAKTSASSDTKIQRAREVEVQFSQGCRTVSAGTSHSTGGERTAVGSPTNPLTCAAITYIQHAISFLTPY